MTKSEIFKKAHEIARNTKHIVGSYAIAFSISLKLVISIAKQAKQVTSYCAGVTERSALNMGENMYQAMVRIFNKTVELNKPKKPSFNWASFDESE